MVGVIYMATCKSTGLSYIGNSVHYENRIRQHNRDKSNDPFHNDIRKYGREDIEWKILEKFDIEDTHELHDILCEREVYWIAFYDTFNNGYNQDPGGMVGYTARFPTEEMRNKCRESGKKSAGVKGMHWNLTEYTKKKQSEAKRNMTEENKRNIAEGHRKLYASRPKKEKVVKERKPQIAWNKGKKMPKEFCERQSQIMKENPNRYIPVHDKPHTQLSKDKIGAAARGCHYKIVDGKRVRYRDEVQ